MGASAAVALLLRWRQYRKETEKTNKKKRWR